MTNLQALAVFIAVAEEHSFSAAAKKLSLTQPTVSFHIDSIERKFGCPLFVRTRRGAELTVYGRTLYENTRNVQDLLERTERKIRDLCAGVSGQVAIGAGTIPGEYILPPLLAQFLRQRPGVSVNLVSADSQSIYKMWQDGKLPICVIGFLPRELPTAQRLWTDEIIPVAAKQMEISTAPWAPEDFRRFPLIVRHASSASMSTVRQAFERLGILLAECNIVLQVTGNEALKAAVQAGGGIGFISRQAVAKELAEGSLVEIPVTELNIRRNFYALRNEDNEMPATRILWEALLAAQSPLLPEAD